METGQLTRVAVIGAGTMGTQISLQTVLSGKYLVALHDTDGAQLERAGAEQRRLMARAVERGRRTAEDAERSLSAISTTTDLEVAAGAADIVIEAVFENFDVKRTVWGKLGGIIPATTVLATNSSTIPSSRLADAVPGPERCCNMHFFHPVLVMQLCEVARGPETSDETVGRAIAFVRSIDRVPVLLQKEIHGFIANRILFAASEEAMRLVEGGYATVEDVDTAVKKGLNWPMGAFELLDFSGLDILLGALDDRAREEGGEGAPAILREHVERGELGRKSGKGFYDYPS